MNERQAAFVEEMGQYLASVGMTPMSGRMLAWMLICDPVEQTAADLADNLQASRGAISGAARALETAGFIRRSRRRGDRREYFSMPPGAMRNLLAGAGQIYHRMTVIAAHGVGVVADLPPPSRVSESRSSTTSWRSWSRSFRPSSSDTSTNETRRER